MPSHWQFVPQTTEEGGLSDFVTWVSLSQMRQLQAHHGTGGRGQSDQGRFQSYPNQDDDHLLLVCQHVERHV